MAADHEWREHTSEGTRLYCATRFGKRWKIKTRLKSEEEWTWPEPPYDPAVLVTLRDLLWAKYQRRKLAYETVCEIDAMLPPSLRRLTHNPHAGKTQPS